MNTKEYQKSHGRAVQQGTVVLQKTSNNWENPKNKAWLQEASALWGAEQKGNCLHVWMPNYLGAAGDVDSVKTTRRYVSKWEIPGPGNCRCGLQFEA